MSMFYKVKVTRNDWKDQSSQQRKSIKKEPNGNYRTKQYII